MVKDLRKNIALVALMIVIFLLPMMGAMAVTPSYTWTFNMAPVTGSPSTSIFIMLRVTPKLSMTQKLHYYIFYDDFKVVDADFPGDTTIGYTRWLDTSILVPSVAKYQTFGAHQISVWMEDPDGIIKTLHLTFTITTDGAIPVNWWENLPPEYFAYVKGTTGATGPMGPVGSQGDTGSIWYNGAGVPLSGVGVNGDYYLNQLTADVYKKVSGLWVLVINIKGMTGAVGATGAIGATGATGAVGAVGAKGATGEIGPVGPAGKDVDMLYVWVAVGCSVVAVVLSLIANARRGEYLQPEPE